MKIVDRIHQRQEEGRPFFSFEYFSPKTAQEARACGNQNILALRGDPPHGSKTWHPHKSGLPSATSLVQYIRATHGDYFGIVTQLFFDVPRFLDWVRKVRKAGVCVEVPIVPGLMPIQTYTGFRKNVVDVGLSVPDWILEGLEAVKEDEVAVRAFGVEVGVKMPSGAVVGSGSSSSVASTLATLPPPSRSPFPKQATLSVIRKDKPWRIHFSPHRRHQEQQRSIFWANRLKSYISRTETWKTFPTTPNQWQRSMEKYGDLNGYGVGLRYSTAAEARCQRGTSGGYEPRRLEDLSEVFQRYWRGELQTLPWCDHPIGAGHGGGREEYKQRLMELNGIGCYLTINSQPVVNGVKSDDKVFGWGPPGGYVYQKAFLEFFVSPDQLLILIDRLKTQFPNYTYNAINHSGSTFFHSTSPKSKSRCRSKHADADNDDEDGKEEEPNTVTWGVFPNHEIVQPTIVERSSFLA
ncbi:hypothetical protein BG015_010561 [Linnemannia schmuckeri]|uniref:MTHFR SAM-binding regulatory domain-containing protein n=1 Tax=Linnemannia schmuckeri TaxID=64567 RepID=A0A9P5V956_9FUNG|nr:hypothetical protein BG015_010561 [Linnemannia schmuckeri]